MAKSTISSVDDQKWPMFIFPAGGLFVAAYMASRGSFYQNLKILSVILVALICWTSFRSLYKQLSLNRATILSLKLVFFGWLVAGLAISSGLPFGKVIYAVGLLGNYPGGITPWLAGFGYAVIFLMIYWLVVSWKSAGRQLGSKLSDFWQVSCRGAILFGLISLVINPAATQLGYWRWVEPSGWLFYKVPLQALSGSILVGFIAMLIIHRVMTLRNYSGRLAASVAYSGLASLWFWTSVNNWSGNILAGMLGLALTYWFGYYILDLEVTPKSPNTNTQDKDSSKSQVATKKSTPSGKLGKLRRK